MSTTSTIRMLRAPLAVLAMMAALSATSGCTSVSASFTGTVPPGIGLTCTATQTAADSAEAAQVLAAAHSGTCVVLTTTSYVGPLVVPAGVSLVAQNGQRAMVTGGTATAPAISLAEGSQLADIDVASAVGVGIAVRAANALLTNVTVTGAGNAAVGVLCKESATPGCVAGAVKLVEVKLEKSGLGLWVSGAHVLMTNGSSDNHTSTSPTSAAGIIAQDGAQLELDGTLVEKNQGAGIVVDGAATKASLKNATINENGERGIWAQNVKGTVDAPALHLDGCTVTKNKIVGVGAVQSHGILVTGGTIASTVAAALVTNLSSTEMVGDGVGLFSSADFKLDATTIELNERAAGVIDVVSTVPLTGIILVGGTVAAGPSGLKLVVQGTSSADVQIATADRSTVATPLGVSAPVLAVPSVLP